MSIPRRRRRPTGTMTHAGSDVTEGACGHDMDGDMLPDALEFAHCALNRYATHRLLDDSDGDGLPDGYEDENFNGFADAGEMRLRRRDTDNDRFEDGLELVLTMNLLVADAGFADSDGDGLPDGVDEYAGRDRDGDRYDDGYETAAFQNLAAANNAGLKPNLGDANGDGAVSNLDALVIQGFFLGNLTHTHGAFYHGGFTYRGFRFMDTSRDGFVSNVDALLAQSHFLNNLDALPYRAPTPRMAAGLFVRNTPVPGVTGIELVAGLSTTPCGMRPVTTVIPCDGGETYIRFNGGRLRPPNNNLTVYFEFPGLACPPVQSALISDSPHGDVELPICFPLAPSNAPCPYGLPCIPTPFAGCELDVVLREPVSGKQTGVLRYQGCGGTPCPTPCCEVKITRVEPDIDAHCAGCEVTVYGLSATHDPEEIEWTLTSSAGVSLPHSTGIETGEAFIRFTVPTDIHHNGIINVRVLVPPYDQTCLDTRELIVHNPDRNENLDGECIRECLLGSIRADWRLQSALDQLFTDCELCRLDNGVGNAFQHAYVSCLLRCYCSQEHAEKCMPGHENVIGNPCFSASMDAHNNTVGLSVPLTADSDCGCLDSVKQALEEGRLRWYQCPNHWGTGCPSDSDIISSVTHDDLCYPKRLSPTPVCPTPCP